MSSLINLGWEGEKAFSRPKRPLGASIIVLVVSVVVVVAVVAVVAVEKGFPFVAASARAILHHQSLLNRSSLFSPASTNASQSRSEHLLLLLLSPEWLFSFLLCKQFLPFPSSSSPGTVVCMLYCPCLARRRRRILFVPLHHPLYYENA